MEDYHIHTNLSVCGLMHGGVNYTYDAIIDVLREKLDVIGLCDHIEGFTDTKKFITQTKIRRENSPDFVKFGAEVSFIKSLEKLTISPEHAKKLDYLIGSVHTTPYYDFKHGRGVHNQTKWDLFGQKKLVEASMDAIKNLAPRVQIIGHPFSQFLTFGSYIGDEAIEEFADIIEGNATAEINLRVLRRVDYDLFSKYILAEKDAGCKFSIGSDAHSFEELDYDLAKKIIEDTKLSKKHFRGP